VGSGPAARRGKVDVPCCVRLGWEALTCCCSSAGLCHLCRFRRMPTSSQKVPLRTECLGHRLHAPYLSLPLVSHCDAALLGFLSLQPHSVCQAVPGNCHNPRRRVRRAGTARRRGRLAALILEKVSRQACTAHTASSDDSWSAAFPLAHRPPLNQDPKIEEERVTDRGQNREMGLQ
jgi:hypothetical protein